MNEESLQRVAHEIAERPRSGLPLRLVGKPAEEEAPALEPPESSTPGAKYALARVNLIMLGSAHEKPEKELLNAEFSFEQAEVGSVVIHTCMNCNDRQSAHGWLFESQDPDFSSERPVGELAISSAGVSSVTAGCPPDYDALRVRVFSAPAKRTRRTRARSTAAVILIALAVTFIVPWIGLMMVAGRNAPAERAREGQLPASAVSSAEIELPLPIVLPTPAPPADAAEKVVAAPVKLRATAVPRKQAAARATQEKPRPAVERAVEPAPAVQGASRTEAPVREPPRVVLAQRAAPVVAETGAQRLAREQALCDDRGFVGKAFCREGARWRHCHPDKWDVAAECMVKVDTMQ
jgi:hypothetical protein